MTEDAERWSEHDLDERFDVGPPHDELSRLAATLDGLLDRLAAGMRRERRLTAEVSHELRTPLAQIQAEVNLALRREREPSEYRRALEEIRASAERIGATIETLLATARQDARLPRGTGDVAEAATRVVGSLGPLADGRRVVVRVDPSIESPRAGVEPEVIERILQPVIENACRHGLGEIRVGVTTENGDVAVTVADDGPGVTPATASASSSPASGGGGAGNSGEAGAGAGAGSAPASASPSPAASPEPQEATSSPSRAPAGASHPPPLRLNAAGCLAALQGRRAPLCQLATRHSANWPGKARGRPPRPNQRRRAGLDGPGRARAGARRRPRNDPGRARAGGGVPIGQATVGQLARGPARALTLARQASALIGRPRQAEHGAMATSLYKGARLGKLPPCLICMGPGHGRAGPAAPAWRGGGVAVRGPPERGFQRRRAGRDLAPA